MPIANSLAYYNAAPIMTLNSFSVKARGLNIIKLFLSFVTWRQCYKTFLGVTTPLSAQPQSILQVICRWGRKLRRKKFYNIDNWCG
jgi:hypothetical protein